METTLNARLADRGIADYVRLEFRPAEQATVFFALRRAGLEDRSRRTAGGLLRRWRSWRAAGKARLEIAPVSD